MISSRTRWLLLVTALFVLAVGVLFHRRQALCADVTHGFARRARIQGASGTDTFVCHAMMEHLPVVDIIVAAACWLSVIALLRSVWIDVEHHRAERRRLEEDNEFLT